MLLPILDANGRRYSPKGQLLSSAAAALRDLDGVDAALRALCDTSTQSAGDNDDDGDAAAAEGAGGAPSTGIAAPCYRLNPDKVVHFLTAKAVRLGRVLQHQADSSEARMRAVLGVFVNKSESVGAGVAVSAAAATASTADADESAGASASASSAAASAGASPPAGSPQHGDSSRASDSSSSSAAASVASVGHAHLTAAVGILSEYLADAWTEATATACG